MRNRFFLLDLEQRCLSPLATRSNSTTATKRKFEERPTRGRFRLPFQRDRDRILHSEAFRKLMHKSQIFPAPLLSQYRTRLTHSLEVNQIARSISNRFGLNEDLTEAIALGHDLGHVPFGHKGEEILRKLIPSKERTGFEHNENSLEVVDTTETSDTVTGTEKGMNLTQATRQGILCHTRYQKENYRHGKYIPQEWKDLGYSSKEEWEEKYRGDDNSLINLLTPEAQVVDMADEVAYLTHDVEDCRRAGLIPAINKAPKELQQFMGTSRKNAINGLINGICKASEESIRIAEKNPSASLKMEYPESTQQLVQKLKDFFENEIYTKEDIKIRLDEGSYYITKLYKHWTSHGISHVPGGIPPNNARETIKYIASLTDQEIIHYYQSIFPPHFVS